MSLSWIEALKWAGAFGKAFDRATAPYYGVNTFAVRPENLEAVLVNADLQKRLARTIGAELESWSERDDRGLVHVTWIMSYQHGVGLRGSRLLAIWRPRTFFPTWLAFCRLIESYEWFLTNELPSSAED